MVGLSGAPCEFSLAASHSAQEVSVVDVSISVGIFAKTRLLVVQPVSVIRTSIVGISVHSQTILHVIEPVSGVLVPVAILVSSLSTLQAILESPFVNISIVVSDFSVAVESVELEVSFVDGSVSELIPSLAVLHASQELSHVSVSIGIDQFPVSTGLVISPVANERAPSGVGDVSRPTFQSIHEISLIRVPSREHEISLSILFSVDPISIVLFSTESIGVDSLPMLSVIEPIAFIDIPVFVEVLSESFLLAVEERALVSLAISEDVHASSMDFVFEPVPDVLVSILVGEDSLSRPILSAELSVVDGAVLEDLLFDLVFERPVFVVDVLVLEKVNALPVSLAELFPNQVEVGVRLQQFCRYLVGDGLHLL